jgi:hypothetical protein
MSCSTPTACCSASRATAEAGLTAIRWTFDLGHDALATNLERLGVAL